MANVKPEVKYTKCFINNEFVDAKNGNTFPTINPATEEVIANIAAGDKADVDAAVQSAKAAFDPDSEWRCMKPGARGELLRKLSDLIERDSDILAALETLDIGKPIKASRAERPFTVAIVRYMAGWCDKITGETISGDKFVTTRYEPIGVCGLIVPWNYPLLLAMIKLSSCVSMGNTCVLKPAEQSPLSALHLASLVKEAGFPPGVINVVPGLGKDAGTALSNHYDIDKISFTGSTAVGRLIQIASGKTNLKRVSLELGGKSPLIVFPDADLGLTVEISHEGMVKNAGQICYAPSRTFVHESIYDEFVKRTVQYAKNRVVGDPFDERTQMGPQVDKRQFEKVLELIESGKQEGATLLLGGKRHGNKGYFIQPTIFSDVQDDMRIAREEIFGPVQSIFKFSTVEEVIRRANDTTYGLAAAVFTKDLNTAVHVSNRLQAGSVWVNDYSSGGNPCQCFGGYKQSGIGRELGFQGAKEFCEVKMVSFNVAPKGAKCCI